MRLIPVVLDSVICFAGDHGRVTLLSSSLGTSTVLDHLAEELRHTTDERIRVLSGKTVDADYIEHLGNCAATTIEVLSPAAFESLVQNLESEDRLLIIEPRRWPVAGFQFERVREFLQGYQGVTHVVAVGNEAEGIREQVVCDANGQVQRVERLYNQTSWPEVAHSSIVYSVVPSKVLKGLAFGSLTQLRSNLAAKGGLSKDVPLRSELLDAASEVGLLMLNEHFLLDSVQLDKVEGFVLREEGVWVHRDAKVDDSARLVPPVAIHAGSRVAGDVTIVGPTVVGRRSTIERGAVLAQVAIMPDSTVAPGISVRHRAVAGWCELMHAEAFRDDVSTVGTEFIWGNGDSQMAPSVRSPRWRIEQAIKRAIDFMVAAVSLAVLSPLFVLAAIAIYLDSPGWPFFIHRREGLGGREFPCMKFRTMIPNAHSLQRELYKQNEVDGPQFKLTHDPRLTRLGGFLRATNLDELPQLFNVLLGHMSLVGPRPSPFRENQICVPWRRARLSVRPGITGLWQVCRSRDRSQGDFHEWVYYDICYVRHFSLWLDFKVLFFTVFTLGGKFSVPLSRLAPDAGGGSVAEAMPARIEV